MDALSKTTVTAFSIVMSVAMTILAVVMSVALTILAMAWIFGIDPDATIEVSQVFKFGIVIAAVAPALIRPITSSKITRAIRERDRAYAELRRIANTDQLTGLHNRRGFDAAVEVAASTNHLDDPTMSVLMIDIDFFKKLNDNFGHDFGDAALVQVAEILRETGQKEQFIVGRQGGDEFIAFLPGISGTKAVEIAEGIRKSCAGMPVEHDGKSADVTVTIGVATRSQTCAVSELIGDADTALYCAKQKGRNRVAIYRSVVSFTRAA